MDRYCSLAFLNIRRPRNVMTAPTGRAQDDLNVVEAEKNRQMIPMMSMKIELIKNLGSLLRPLFLNDMFHNPPNSDACLLCS